jgi:CubicO group peptidase (beta-lactamase class C family)
MADGGICATLRDVGRFGLLFAAGSRAARRHQVVPAAWISDTIAGAPDGARAFLASDEAPGFPADAHYRNFWWVHEPSVPFFYAAGINGQNVFVHVPSQTVVAKLSTWPTALSSKLRATTDAALAIAEFLIR